MQNNFKSGAPEPINLKKILSVLTPAQKRRIAEGYDLPSLCKVFSNEGLMTAVNAFWENGMNVSLTARSLYMHRNTVIYKLNAVKRLTGFELRNFDMALTFKILHIIYMQGKV